MKSKRKPRERLYRIWQHMKDRCYNHNCDSYHNYGGRGITVCDEWRNNYQNFQEWALRNGYTDDLTIDRSNVNGNYEPSNCRWLTQQEQSFNKRTNRTLTYKNKTQTLTEWATELNINSNTLLYRLRRGWTVERALSTGAR